MFYGGKPPGIKRIYTKGNMDRYFSRFRTFGIPEKLEEMHVLVQANATFFCGSNIARAMRILQKEQIHLLGSDCHNLSSRQPNLSEAVDKIQKHCGKETLERIAAFQSAVLGDDASWCL